MYWIFKILIQDHNLHMHDIVLNMYTYPILILNILKIKNFFGPNYKHNLTWISLFLELCDKLANKILNTFPTNFKMPLTVITHNNLIISEAFCGGQQ